MNARTVGFVLGACVVLLTIAHVLSLMVHHAMDNKVSELLVEKFSVDLERNFPTHFTSLLLFFSSLLFSGIGVGEKRSAGDAKGWYWFGLSLIFLFLSFDEAAHIHEHFDGVTRVLGIKTSGYLAWPWVITYGLLVAMFTLAYVKFWLRLPASFRIAYLLSGAVYVGASLGFELLEAKEYVVNSGVYTARYFVFTSIEEVLEMSAISYLVYTNLRYLAVNYPELRLSFSLQKS
jgi:hypothetical protein